MAAASLPSNHADAFEAFYVDLRGRAPYRWQVRAAAALAEGALFDRLAAPTGAGKTTLVECFLFALAWQGNQDRVLPLRLFWVIDRRGVVDQVHEHAVEVADALAARVEHGEGPAAAVAERLAGFDRTGAHEAPVRVARWRGGVERDVEPLSPTCPTVICTTVDQVGSRLLFRGYGTSPRSRPIDAALVATDSLIVLDEAHLSRPFEDTAGAVRCFHTRSHVTLRPLHVLSVSATLRGADNASVFELTEDELHEAPLRRRLATRKHTRLVRARKRVAELLVAEAKRLDRPGALVGVIANTVADARQVHARLSEVDEHSLLVIGPVRPLDRARILRDIPSREARDHPAAARFVVATQTIEVGLDLDFDALVSAAAPFPALAQRLGRLDRAGEVGETEAAVVLGSDSCPLYGPTAEEAFSWLEARSEDGVIDLGPQAVRELQRLGAPLPPEPLGAPLLCSWHVELFAQTTLTPEPSPDVGPFLHGEDALETSDVRIAWRADLARGEEETWGERVAARPPHATELLSVSVIAARRWLEGGQAPVMGDIESAVEAGAAKSGATEGHAKGPFVVVPPPGPDRVLRPELRLEARDLRPGDVIVVPSDYGGCDRFGWDPRGREPVEDLGNLARRRVPAASTPSDGEAITGGPDDGLVRVLVDSRLEPTPELASLANEARDALIADLRDGREVFDELWPHALAWTCPDGGQSAGRRPVCGRARLVPADAPDGLLLEVEPPTRIATGAAQRYEDHVRRVEERAEAFAASLAVAGPERAAVRFAARYHDLGKLDPRFQAWLNGGTPPDPEHLLAKSGTNPRGAAARRAREAAGWPRGKRHEALSAALLDAWPGPWPEGVDRDLVLHLVLTHHGQYRPFMPDNDPDLTPTSLSAEIEGTQVGISSDSEISWHEQAERFVALNRRYGPWGLATIEAALVLGDRQASAEEGVA